VGLLITAVQVVEHKGVTFLKAFPMIIAVQPFEESAVSAILSLHRNEAIDGWWR
jgi:hypothetical protein